MKKFNILILLVFISGFVFSQNWTEEIYLPDNGKNFYEIQKEFKNYWSNYDVKSGYYYRDGKKQKAPGWKQFKRWEWYWETRINRETGEFPDIDILKIQQEYSRTKDSKADQSSWQSVGPGSSDGGYAGIGRINCVAFHPSDDNTFWIGAPSGGLWKTINGGSTWECLTDDLPVIGVSEIIIPSDYAISKTVYIATGDRDAGDNNSIGVLKTTDDGETWVTTGLTFDVSSNYRITRMLVDPSQQNIFYAATTVGIYKSINSGDNWNLIKSGTFFDLEFQYGSENTVLYAATRDYSGAPKIFKTTDAGAIWNSIYTFPTDAYRIELDVAQSDPNVIYALACNQSYALEGIYKSINSGSSFTQVLDGSVSGNNVLGWESNGTGTQGQGFYDLTLSVSPLDEDIVFVGGVNTWNTTDGGANWNINNHWWGDGVPAVHADKHYMEYQNSTTLFEANDGGIYKTTNNGSSWIDLTDGMIISQMYKLGVSQTVKDEVITGLQDNGSKLISSSYWEDVKGGDGMECIIDYTDVNVQYATYVEGQIDRTTNHWATYGTDISANIPGGPNGAWVTPYILDPINNQTIYVGYEDVWKTTNRGGSWTKISNLSLTNKIRSIAIAPSDNNTLYITDFDNLYKTTNGGSSWTNLTSYLPSTSNNINYISIDANDALHLWIVFGGYDNMKAFESTDGGSNWSDISNGLPSVPANTIIENKLSGTQQLYTGTDIGVFFKEGSSDWELFSEDLPSVIVTELEIHYDETTPENNTIYASTYGRGLWKSSLSTFELPAIVLQNVDGTYYVTDDTSAVINVVYDINETFLSNTFTAYLSDETGDFSSEIAIGSLDSDFAGVIEAEIPAGTISGSGYKIKVKSSNPVRESEIYGGVEVLLNNAPSGIRKHKDFGVKVFPNPSNGKVNIEINKDYNVANIFVMDLSGKIIHSETLSGNSTKEIDLSDYAKGMYIVQLNVDSEKLISKIIIE